MAAKDGHDRGGGPLAFLDRLLDDERDSNLHFGDVRFWKHVEHIDTKRIYSTKSLEYRTMKMMFCEAVFYLLFLAVITSFIVTHRTGSLYESRRQQIDYWAGCRRTPRGRSCRIEEVTSAESLMQWLREELAPKAFVQQEMYGSIVNATSIFRMQSGSVPWTPRYVGDTKTSVLIGNIRIRQLRVQYNRDCSIPSELAEINADCFPKYSPGVESKLKWHPTWTPDHIRPHYKWYGPNETEQADTIGYHGVYPGSGFVLDLPLNLTGAKMRLRELEDWSWLDHRTRAVIVELSTLNPNVNVFVHGKMLFEFPATGGVVMKQDFTSFRAIQLSLPLAATDDLGGSFAMLTLTTGLFLMLLLYVTFLIYKNGVSYLSYFWSVVDVLILLLFFILVCTYFTIFAAAAREPSLHPEVIGDPEMFFTIGKLVPDLEFSNSVLACVGLMCWLKVLKYFTLFSIFMGFVRVIERCIVNLLFFAGLLFLVLFGFAVALYLGYGAEGNVFATIWGSLVAVIVAPAGGVDLEPIIAPGDLLGPVLIFMYISLVFLLLLKTFMAICVDTYSVCTYEIGEVTRERKHNPTVVFLWAYFNAMKSIKLVGKESEEERGGDDEQEIPLAALPEAIQDRFLEEKRRMERLLDSANGEVREQKQQRLRELGMLSSTSTTLASTAGPAAGGAAKFALEDSADREGPLPPPTLSEFPPPPPEDDDAAGTVVKRVQLQRMLEDYPVLAEICGTERAVDVVRRFRVDSGVGPYEAVAQLQASVARKLRELEAQGMELSFDDVEALKTVSQELHSALTESQKEWRAELLSVMQMASLLSKSLIDLTGQMAKVQVNHNELSVRASAK